MGTWFYTQWRRLRRFLGLNTMHGVRYGGGSRERTGFKSRREARAWIQDSIRYDIGAVVFDYELAVDMLLPDITSPFVEDRQRRSHVTVDSSVPPPRATRPPSNRAGGP